MKLQGYELPIGKPPQTRRKPPKIAPVLLILTFLLTIIPVYYPSLRYNLKKLTEPASNSFDSIISPADDDGLNLLHSKIVEKADELIGIDAGVDQRRSDESTVVESTEGRRNYHQVSNTDDKLESAGIVNELHSEIEEKGEELTAGIDESTAKVDLGIANESPEETNNNQLPEKVETGGGNIVDEGRSWKSGEESTEVKTYQPSNEGKGRRKRTGKKGRRRNSHRKKDPVIRKAGIQREHEENYGGSTTTATTGITTGSSSNKEEESKEHDDNNSGVTTFVAATTNNEVESKATIPDNPISLSSTCDLFTGEWIPNPEGPYYTNETCFAIQEHQNCLKFGRPDNEYLKWRWKPDECELPIFDPSQFLQLVRGKSLAFVGDSVARNHMQSLICLLSRVVYPEDLSKSINDQNRLYLYKDYNFTISMYWSPYLIKTELTEPGNVTRPFNLFLDEFDQNWTTKINRHDFIIISAGQWFMRPTYFYEKQKLVGCLYCPSSDNTTYLTSYFSYRRAFRTSFKAINSLEGFNGVVYLRTFAPSHFEGGAWDRGGTCSRTRPFRRNETVLEDYAEKMYKIQLEEFEIARREGRRKGMEKFRLFDSTKTMLLRPDGHPSKYGHWPDQKVELAEDCVHWCLPGPIDAWNDFLLELLKREQDIAIQ